MLKKLTNFVKHSPAWEANICLAVQEILQPFTEMEDLFIALVSKDLNT